MKQKKIIIVVSIILIICLIICAINNFNKNTEDTEINVLLGSEPNSLDPAISLTIDVRSYMANMFEGLVNLGLNGELKPGVATKWEPNEDNTEYIFYLRKDIKWSDGSQIIANDFKYSWLRVLEPETASGWASYLYYIKDAENYNSGKASEEDVGIYVMDDNTLKVVMESPCSFFASMTALQPYYPVKKSMISEYGANWTQSADTYITNGVFKLQNWEHDSKISIVKNLNYWNQKEVKVSKINFMLYSDSSAILNAYEAGELDYVQSMLTSEEMQQVAEIDSSDFVYTKFLAMNLNSKVFEDINVRKAISLALDREEIAKLIGTEMEALTSFIPYGFYNSDENKDFTEDSNSTKYLEKNAKIEEAKKILKDAGYEDGIGIEKITYLTNTSSTNVALSEIVKSQLSKIGINIEIQALEGNVFNIYRKEKKFDLVAASWGAEYPDITSYLYGFRSTDLNNYSSYNNKEFDDIYKKILLEKNTKERLELTHQAEDMVMKFYCVAPLYSQKLCFISKDKIKGFYHDITGNLIFSESHIK